MSSTAHKPEKFKRDERISLKKPFLGATFSYPIGYGAYHEGVIVTEDKKDLMNSTVVHYGVEKRHERKEETLREALIRANQTEVEILYSYCNDQTTLKHINKLFHDKSYPTEYKKRTLDGYVGKEYDTLNNNCQHFASKVLGYPNRCTQSTGVGIISFGGLAYASIETIRYLCT